MRYVLVECGNATKHLRSNEDNFIANGNAIILLYVELCVVNEVRIHVYAVVSMVHGVAFDMGKYCGIRVYSLM